MSDEKERILKIIEDMVCARVEQKDYDGVLRIMFTYAAMHFSLPGGEEARPEVLKNLKAWIEIVLSSEHGLVESLGCSFCGRSGDDGRLFGGGEARICETCVRDLNSACDFGSRPTDLS